MTYAEKLKDPRWQRKRLEIMQRDGFKCRSCPRKDATLHVHHLVYLKGQEPWDYADDDLVTVCWECHEKMEESRLFLLRHLTSHEVIMELIRFLNFGDFGESARLATKAFSHFINAVDSCCGVQSEDPSYELAGLKDAFTWLVGMLVHTKENAEGTALDRSIEFSEGEEAVDER